jgi:hypothetical protein
MASALADQLEATKLGYGKALLAPVVDPHTNSVFRSASSDPNWKEKLTIPKKDARPQTEVGSSSCHATYVHANYFERT